MKKIIIVAIVSFYICNAFSQEPIDAISLVVSGEGETKTDATALALRSAIEQAFGTFVSANTTILNDELVRDEIATITSGNIQKYDELSCVQLENGNFYVTVNATVSIQKLISYAQSHGSTAEFAGQTFVMKTKLEALNKKNEKIAIENLLTVLRNIAPKMYDYEIEVGDPSQTTFYTKYRISDNYLQRNGESTIGYIVPIEIRAFLNDNHIIFMNTLLNTLKNICSTNKEADESCDNCLTIWYKHNDSEGNWYEFELRNDWYSDLITNFIKEVVHMLRYCYCNEGLQWTIKEKSSNNNEFLVLPFLSSIDGSSIYEQSKQMRGFISIKECQKVFAALCYEPEPYWCCVFDNQFNNLYEDNKKRVRGGIRVDFSKKVQLAMSVYLFYTENELMGIQGFEIEVERDKYRQME